jgi:hypothetical protein
VSNWSKESNEEGQSKIRDARQDDRETECDLYKGVSTVTEYANGMIKSKQR